MFFDCTGRNCIFARQILEAYAFKPHGYYDFSGPGGKFAQHVLDRPELIPRNQDVQWMEFIDGVHFVHQFAMEQGLARILSAMPVDQGRLRGLEKVAFRAIQGCQIGSA